MKAALFGLFAGLVACYRGLTISGGGAKAVGNAVNETVVFAFMALFVINVVVTAIGIQLDGEVRGVAGMCTDRSWREPLPAGVVATVNRPVGMLGPHRGSDDVLRQGDRRDPARGDALRQGDHPVDRRDLHGCWGVGDDRRHAGDRRVLDVGHRRHAGRAGLPRLGNIGIEALTGFLAAFINVRISAPVVAGIGLAATFGAGVTAQLGAMRINEEIDALESMGIRPIQYLVSTRIVAGMIAITPLYSIAVIL